MTITVSRNSRGIPRLEIHGKLTYDKLHSALRIWVNYLIQRGVRRILVDLAPVDRIDSAGIGELIHCYRKLAEVDGRLILLNPPRKVAILFQRAGLNLISGIGVDDSGDTSVAHADGDIPIRTLEPSDQTGFPASGPVRLSDWLRNKRKRMNSVRGLAGYLPLLVMMLSGPAIGAPVSERLGVGLGRGPELQPAVAYAVQPKGKKHRRVEKFRIIVREYYRDHALPPGLAKRDRLPPGLSRQLAEEGRLPPGLQKRLYAVPPALAHRLGPPPPGHGWFFLGVDLILLDSRSNVVVEIVADVLP